MALFYQFDDKQFIDTFQSNSLDFKFTLWTDNKFPQNIYDEVINHSSRLFRHGI